MMNWYPIVLKKKIITTEESKIFFRYKDIRTQDINSDNYFNSSIKRRGQKNPLFPTFISLAGKYIVLMPNTPKEVEFHEKFFNSSDRQKIRAILEDLVFLKYRCNSKNSSTNKTK